MSIFRKDVDVLDLTDMQRRGLLKKTQDSPKENISTDKTGYVDLSNNSQTVQPSVQSENPFSFLDAPQTPTQSFFSSPSVSANSVDTTELQTLKVKLEDLEYKLDRLMEKIAKLEEN